MVVHSQKSPAGTPQQSWAPYRPDADRPWNLARAGHLFRRAAFGASWEQLERAISDGPERTIDKLLQPDADTAAFSSAFDEFEASVGDADAEPLLRGWWLRRMLETPHPLQEKMTLFWHGQLATSGARVKRAQLLRAQIKLLRDQALGDFHLLLRPLLRDPATLLGHGADKNRKAEPNQRFAEQLLSQFTLGPDQCSKEDVREAARACTGSFVVNGKYRFVAREHDEGQKALFGQTGRFGDEDLLRILLEQPATAETLVRRLYRWLISETEEPAAQMVAPLAGSFAADHDIRKLVETMLRSNLFFSVAAYRQKIKSPVEFAIGIVVALEGMISTTELSSSLGRLGQTLLRPPTASGWTGGRHWISESTLVARHNLALDLLRGDGRFGDRLNPREFALKHGRTQPADAARFLLELLLQGDTGTDVCETLRDEAPDAALRRLTHTICTLPEFQLA